MRSSLALMIILFALIFSSFVFAKIVLTPSGDIAFSDGRSIPSLIKLNTDGSLYVTDGHNIFPYLLLSPNEKVTFNPKLFKGV